MEYAIGEKMKARQRVSKACLYYAAMTVLLGGTLATAPARSETSPFTGALVDLFGVPGVPETREQVRSTDSPVAISAGTAPEQFGEASAAFGTGGVGFQGSGVGVGSAWSDGFTLTGGGGGSGQLAVSANVQAAITGSNADISYELWVSSSPFDIDVVIAAYDSDGPIPNAQQRMDFNTGVSANTAVFGTVPFTYGVPFYLLSVISGDIDYAASLVVNVSASTVFGIGPSGLVGLSGTTYVAAVPEPTTWALLAAGLAFMAFVTRNRSRART